MNAVSQMVGYDVRWFPPDFFTVRWDEKQRMQYLLRPDTARPLSIDKTVWPSRFQVGEGERNFFVGYPESIKLDPDSGNKHFLLFDLWDSLGEMLAHYKPATEPEFGIGAGLVKEEHYPEDALIIDNWWKAIHSSQIDPPEPKGEWSLLGYDVANSGLTSAISNCGVSEEELSTLREKWAGGINEHGLFQTVNEALRFCVESNERLGSEGPFYVWELFLIWKDLNLRLKT